MKHLDRRAVLGGASAFAFAASFANAAPRPAAAPKLPARRNVVIRNAYVMTMEPPAI